MPEFYTAAQIAKTFQVSRQAVYDWIEEGRLKAVRPGGENGRLRISQEALDEFLKASEAAPKEVAT